MEEYFDYEKCTMIASEAVKIWEDIIPKFPNDIWWIHIKCHRLCLAGKAKQELQQEIQNLLFLKNILNNHVDIYIIDSLKFRFLARIDKYNTLFSYPTLSMLSSINVLLDRINLFIINIFLISGSILLFIYALSYNIIRHKKNNETNEIKYIWDGISPRELSTYKDKITYTWIVDDKTIFKKNVLFLVPKADFQMKKQLEEQIPNKGFITANHINFIRLASIHTIVSSSFTALKIFINNIIFPGFSLNELLNMQYKVMILKWIPVIETLKPIAYVNCSSNIANEIPAIIYFNSVGMKTVTWSYGTNSYLFTTHDKNCDFRNVIFCNLLNSSLVVWNKLYSDFIQNHVQDGLKVSVIGPLMAGDESVINTDRQVLRKNLGLISSNNDDFKYITFFDVPPVSKGFVNSNIFTAIIPDSNTEEYACAFIKDCLKLLEDFENLFLIYKPKRSLTSGKFSYSKELSEIFDRMTKNPRVIILDYNINPWIPLALADMCISMPFESPSIACLHHRKIGLFHDPLNLARHHKYEMVNELISHNYNELRIKVEKYLLNNYDRGEFFNSEEIKSLMGLEENNNSTNKFREYLAQYNFPKINNK